MVKKFDKTIILTLSLLISTAMLLGFVSQSYAQTDQGWTKPVNLSLSGIATNPLLVVDSNNTLHAIWVDLVDGYKYSESEDGGIWTKPKTVNYPFDKKGALPVMLTDASGTIHVFWINKNKELSYVRATPTNIADPAKWQSGTARLAAGVINYDVATDSDGSLHVAYISNVNTETVPAGVYYRQLLVSGGGWSKETKLYESGYFRSPSGIATFIRIAISNEVPDQKVYVTWDSRPEKSVFIAISNDTGQSWNEAKKFKSAGDTGGIDTPFNLNVAAVNNKVLLMWQEGEPGTATCDVFSQWSENNGKSWGDIVAVFNASTGCPVSSKLVAQKSGNILAMLAGQVDPIFIAWNGKQWSKPQTQTQLPVLSNPLTFDGIQLGCRFDLITQNRLYVIGCDQADGGDVWFISRTLEPLRNWFSIPRTWNVPVTISMKSETITSLSSITDSKGDIHSVWAQSSVTGDGTQNTAINYARWDGKEWTTPEPVLSSLKGVPVQISFSIDNDERLLLTWVDGESGDLLFSWANLERANLASEWETPVILPSPSNLTAASDIVVDATGRIVVVYAISLNENRGIYVVQSSDGGKNWSSPVRIFDAVSTRWDKVEAPKISLTADGALHVIFSRSYVRAGQPTGLYYSRSFDGGRIWTDPQVLSEGYIQWSDIASYSDHSVHVLWQEFDGLLYANLSQESQDSGASWSKKLSITGVNDSSTPIALAADGLGKLHFVQLLKNSTTIKINQDSLILQDWNWTGSKWELESSTDLNIQGQGINYSLVANFTKNGYLVVSLSTEYSDSKNRVQNNILTLKRFVGESNISKEQRLGLIPIPVVLPSATQSYNISPTEITDLSLLDANTAGKSSPLRNLVGVTLIGLIVVVATLLIIRRSNKPA